MASLTFAVLTPKLLTTLGEIRTTPRSFPLLTSAKTGTKSIPIGDFPGSSRRKLGSIGATQ